MAAAASAFDDLVARLRPCRRIFVLTGAGVSTESGIPDYRDADGEWKHPRPMTYRQLLASAAARRRYWARSLVGWRRIAAAEPNAAHHALARLEAAGRLGCLVTQNVDGLHAKAGSRRVIDLHGRLDRVECLGCRTRFRRHAFQLELERLNPGWAERAAATLTPDGDAELHNADYDAFRVPPCPRCGGVLKPWVVFFGERVPPPRVERAFAALRRADAVLVAGSSLMVFSGYRFARAGRQLGLPLCLVNLGRTRADADADVKIAAPCGEVLPRLVAALVAEDPRSASRSRPGNGDGRAHRRRRADDAPPRRRPRVAGARG
ncbi:MAG: NAD-dependent protein deacetylase [Acidobacteria bacterium]|nr:MAG: NAD-dependent protein deacetylase [Acidobacteriota bacterium]